MKLTERARRADFPLGFVNEITLADNHALGEFTCLLQAFSRLEATGFQFRKGSDLRGINPYRYRVFSLIDVAAEEWDVCSKSGCVKRLDKMKNIHHSIASMIIELLNSQDKLMEWLRRSKEMESSYPILEIDKFGKTMSTSSEESFASMLITLNDYFSNLEASISAIGVGCFSFDKLCGYRELWPDVNTWDDQWFNYNTEDALSVMDTNLNKLDEYISTLLKLFKICIGRLILRVSLRDGN